MQNYNSFCCHINSILVISSVLNLKLHTCQGRNLCTVSPAKLDVVHADHCWEFGYDHILKYIISVFCLYG